MAFPSSGAVSARSEMMRDSLLWRLDGRDHLDPAELQEVYMSRNRKVRIIQVRAQPRTAGSAATSMAGLAPSWSKCR